MQQCLYLLYVPVPLTKLYMGSVVDPNSTGFVLPDPDSEGLTASPEACRCEGIYTAVTNKFDLFQVYR